MCYKWDCQLQTWIFEHTAPTWRHVSHLHTTWDWRLVLRLCFFVFYIFFHSVMGQEKKTPRQGTNAKYYWSNHQATGEYTFIHIGFQSFLQIYHINVSVFSSLFVYFTMNINKRQEQAFIFLTWSTVACRWAV